jgi:hypothetical protein
MIVLGIPPWFNHCTIAYSLSLGNHLSYIALTQMSGRPVFNVKEKHSGILGRYALVLPSSLPLAAPCEFLAAKFSYTRSRACVLRRDHDPMFLRNSESSEPSHRLSSCNVRLDSSSNKTRSDYSVEKRCHKLDFIATIPQLLSCAIECLVR